jgi:ribonuclease PH
MRSDKREDLQIRDIKIERNFTKNASGSVLISYGETKVLCTATLEEKVPHFLKDSGKGWLTAEYSMLPGSTHTRCSREVNRGKASGRTNEIQRLIGRALRAAIDLDQLPDISIIIDADVIQADGGTRTASITGGMVALYDAVQKGIKDGVIKNNPIREWVAAISVGKVDGKIITDLCYEEDSQADLDMNVVMTESGGIVEVQGTAENKTITKAELNLLVDASSNAIKQILSIVKPE